MYFTNQSRHNLIYFNGIIAPIWNLFSIYFCLFLILLVGGLRPETRPKGEIVLENVTFSYQGAPLIRGMNLHLTPGKSIALVGRSGCGKSTIASLILRLYDPDEGRILLDGVDIRHLDPVWLRSHIGFVSQVSRPGSYKLNNFKFLVAYISFYFLHYRNQFFLVGQ